MKRIVRGLLPLLALAFWGACSEEKPAATTAPAVPAAALQADGSNLKGAVKSSVGGDDWNVDDRGVATLSGTFQGPEIALGVIGREGGRLRLAEYEVVVPRGAVDGPTVFSIRVKADKRRLAIAEFGPHNQQFNVPVTIILPWRDTSLGSSRLARVLWWDSKTWVPVPSSFTSDGRISAHTIHFSMWACGLTVAGG